MNPYCSIIIRCNNEEKHIDRLLHGIMQQTIADKEIVVVDSGSTDSTLEIASRYPVKIVSIKPEDFSFGSALNIGLGAASGEFAIFASAHVYPLYNDWLEKLLKPFSDPKIALTYGKQRGGETTKFSEHRVFAKWFPDESNFKQTHPFCNNANAAIRRALWERFPYDETLTGLEDLHWARRAIDSGNYVAYVAEAVIAHIHNESMAQIYNRYFREGISLKRSMDSEGFSLWDFLRLVAGNIVSDYYHALREGKFFKNFFSIPAFRSMQLAGTYKGFRYVDPIDSQLKRRFYYPGGFKASSDASIGEKKAPIDYSVLGAKKENR